MLLHGHDLIHTLSLIVLQHLYSHDTFHGGFMSCFFFAVHLLSTPMAIRNQHSNSSSASHKAPSGPRHHYRRLNLMLPRHPRHLLLLPLVLPHQMLQTCSQDPFHYGFASYFFVVVRLPHMPMVINAACIQLFYKCIEFFCI